MNHNSTQKEVKDFVKKVFYASKKSIAFTAVQLMLCGRVMAQNTDLPNPDANLQTAPAGTLVIAMDNTNQAKPGYFNLKAYGLVVTLLNNDRKLRWVITAGKAKNGTDISVPAYSVTNPVVVTAGSKITLTAGSSVASVHTIIGTLQVGMAVTATGVPVGTTIQSINSATQITLSANAVSNQSNINVAYAINAYPVSTYNFKAGPFIIFPADTVGVRAIINNFNNAQAAADRVNVFCTNIATTVDVRYNMTGIKPKAAVIDDGGNANIHVTYMTNASIPPVNYIVLPSATGLTSGCFTFASEPHNGSQGPFIDSIKSFVLQGGNFLAQCHAITTYENWVSGHFQSTAGFDNTNVNISSNVNFLNNDLSYTQFEGGFNTNIGGNTQVWTFSAGSTFNNNFYPAINGGNPGQGGYYGATGSKLRTGKGGNVYFLGNHNYNSISDPLKINGQRMYLNAMLTPALTPACANNAILPVQLNYFAAKKVNNSQVQLNWSTASEQNAREFIIERSADGLHFTELKRVAAVGNSSIEIKYNTPDTKPLNGKNFYRLLQTDFDGAKAYSSIVMLNMSITNSSIEVYPNPARGVANINLNNLPMNKTIIGVFDIAGKLVISQLPVNGNTVKLNISTLQSGTYVVKVTNTDGAFIQQKLIVTN